MAFYFKQDSEWADHPSGHESLEVEVMDEVNKSLTFEKNQV